MRQAVCCIFAVCLALCCTQNNNSVACAYYLDDLAELSRAMNGFVDALLDKVSLLAELMIDEALDEQCEPLQCAASARPERSARQITQPDDLDLLEFGAERAGELLRQIANSATIAQATRAEEQDDADGDAALQCRLFKFKLRAGDLPAAGMQECCGEFHRCYATCSMAKQQCDARFRACLSAACRARYDYRNATLVRAHSELARRERDTQSEPLLAADDLDVGADELEGDVAASASPSSSCYDEASSSERDKRHATGEDAHDEQQLEPQVKRVRDKYKACKLGARVLIIGNLAFGCSAYRRSQQRACCASSPSRSASHNNTTAAAAAA